MEPLFGNYLVAGMLDVVEDVTVYASAKDRALGVSKWVFGRERLGQIVSTDMSEAADSYLWRNGNLIIVNATDTPGADLGNVHAYFRQSPWDQQRYSGDSVVRSKARGTGPATVGRPANLGISARLYREAAGGIVIAPPAVSKERQGTRASGSDLDGHSAIDKLAPIST